jgi:hypothetical protein
MVCITGSAALHRQGKREKKICDKKEDENAENDTSRKRGHTALRRANGARA